MQNITSNNPNRQLSLIEIQLADVRRVEHEGVEYFSLVDLMAVFSELESRPVVLWRRTRDRLEKDGFQLYQKVIRLKLIAQDGKSRETDCTDGYTLFRIVQSIPSPKAEDVRNWLAALGYQAYQEMRDSKAALQRAKMDRLYEESGYGQNPAVKLFRQRNHNIDNFKSLMATISRVCENPDYGHFINAEYLALFDKIASELRDILNTKDIRDALPMLQLTTLTTAEARIDIILNRKAHMTMDELLYAVEKYIRPMGVELRQFCDDMGIHHVTGQPLVASGNDSESKPSQKLLKGA